MHFMNTKIWWSNFDIESYKFSLHSFDSYEYINSSISALNLMSNFNLENVTTFMAKDDGVKLKKVTYSIDFLSNT